MIDLLIRCPDSDRGPQPDGGGRSDVVGCGATFPIDLADHIANGDDCVDCPACGIFFSTGNPDPTADPMMETQQ